MTSGMRMSNFSEILLMMKFLKVILTVSGYGIAVYMYGPFSGGQTFSDYFSTEVKVGFLTSFQCVV